MSHDFNSTHLCLVCKGLNARLVQVKIGSGTTVETTCPDCKAIGTISNAEPWYGRELPIDLLRSIFAVAGIPIISDPRKLQNRYWSEESKYYHPWWFVKTPFGWIEIGWRKRVISIDWTHTTIRTTVTTDDVTKDEAMVHAYSEAKAVEYLTALKQAASVEATT
jgi:hypothetical protein